MKGLVITRHLSAADVYHQGTPILDLIKNAGGLGAALSVPAQADVPIYDGTEQTLSLSGFPEDAMILDGTLSATDAGTYEALVTPGPGYFWADDESRTTRVIEWTIARQPIPRVTLARTLYTYNGSSISPAFSNVTDGAVESSGDLSATTAGSKTAIFQPTDNYEWQDGGNITEPIQIEWEISKAQLPAPTITSSHTYTGSAQTPTVSGYDASLMTLTQVVSDVTSAGAKTARLTLKDTANYEWAGSEADHVDVAWTISKANGTASANKQSVTLNETSGLTTTVGITRSGTGDVSAVSSDTAVASVSVSGTTLTITGKKSGSTNITVSVAGDDNYNAPSNITISVAVVVAQKLSDCTAAEIQSIVKSGQAKNYWKVGDTMPRTLNGTVGGYTFDNFQALDVILDFDHNATVEGENTMHVGLCWKSADGTSEIALCHSNYNSTCSQGSAGFYMNPSTGTSGTNDIKYGTTQGGWRDCYFRSTLAPQLLAAISDASFRSIISEHQIYTSNGAKETNNTAAEVTQTKDKIFLPAEYEIFGARTYANTFEAQYQTQLAYMANGAPKIAKKHTDTSAAASWLERSPRAGYVSYFCPVSASGGASNTYAYYSRGVRAVFVIS